MSDARPVAIVTGAADGIGWATAQRFAADGYRVALVDLRAAEAAVRAETLGTEHLGLGADITVEAEVVTVIGQVLERWQRIDVLVNNAGIADQGVPTLEQSVERFDQVLNVHLRGAFLFSREAARSMVGQGRGAIVNLSSITGYGGIPGRNAYGAAKAGVAAMTRAMACEWARQGVRVNAVVPGYVRTALVEGLERDGVLDTAAIGRRTPMGRMAQPVEIAAAIAFLASTEASFITGTTLDVDGGWLAFGAPESALH